MTNRAAHTGVGGFSRPIASSSLVAVTVAPSVRIVPATALARARVSGGVPSRSDRGVRWRCPTRRCGRLGTAGPSSGAPSPHPYAGLGRQCRRQRGRQGPAAGLDPGVRWRCPTRPRGRPGTAGSPSGHRCPRRACSGGIRRGVRAAARHDSGHSAEECLLVDLADDDTVVALVDGAKGDPPVGEPGAPASRTDRVHGHLGDVLRRAHAAESQVHGWCAGVPERHSFGRERTGVGPDPRTGLHGVEVRRLQPRGGGRVRRLHGWSVETGSRMLAACGRPIDTRCVFSATASVTANSASMLQASRSHSARSSVTPGGNSRPSRAGGGSCDGVRTIGC